MLIEFLKEGPSKMFKLCDVRTPSIFGRCHPKFSLYSNHPVIKDDGVLSVFLSETSLEEWRKHTPISLDEESASKRIDRAEEMSIPSDLEDKITYDLRLQ